MRKMSHAPSLSCDENIKTLEPRKSPYWNILVFCRHLGLQKLPTGKLFWMARIRKSDGNYRQARLGPHISWDSSGLDYEQALARANDWFNLPDILAVASDPYSVGVNTKLKYTKTDGPFTVGDAMHSGHIAV